MQNVNKKDSRQHNRFRAVNAVFAVILLLMAVLIVALNLDKWMNRVDGGKSEKELELEMRTVYLKNEPYLWKESMTNWVIIGLDRNGTMEPSDAYYNTDQADFILVVSVDDEAKKVSFVQINRDTMTRVSRLGVTGEKYEIATEQIALSHTYGDGMATSCLNTTEAVSKFLKGLKTDRYVCVTMEAVPVLTDALGGVDVTLDGDYHELDETYSEGKTVRMDGDRAMAFIRARAEMDDPTNVARMGRQKLFMNSALERLKGREDFSTDFALSLYEKLNPYMITDASTGDIKTLADCVREYSHGPIRTPEGRSEVGEEFMEFYADDDDLSGIIAEIFCDKKE